jgi:Lon protease-like protein
MTDIGDDKTATLPGLPLFPLQTVLFPSGLLALKVFEARYLDMVGQCLRSGSSFGVVCLRQGGEVRPVKGSKETVRFENQGVLARLDEVDAEQAGILKVRCTGTQRFLLENARQQPDGLWLADATLLEDDEPAAPAAAMHATVKALAEAILSLREQGAVPFTEPHRLDDAGWVANRWCELLPITLSAKQKLMELDDPQVRLQLVDEFLRSKGVVS